MLLLIFHNSFFLFNYLAHPRTRKKKKFLDLFTQKPWKYICQLKWNDIQKIK